MTFMNNNKNPRYESLNINHFFLEKKLASTHIELSSPFHPSSLFQFCIQTR